MGKRSNKSFLVFLSQDSVILHSDVGTFGSGYTLLGDEDFPKYTFINKHTGTKQQLGNGWMYISYS